ncbi:PEP-CTERM sorting domain-containing protein [Roseateles sp. BYS87W]|uniref:PEP-CTERM sorting domain-containing protein n=1 Tax=Pelomonas baiyunensis TaxID=3299026 RepID=A0ABW7H1E9_9BURK
MIKEGRSIAVALTVTLSAIASNAQVVARGDGTFEDVVNGLIWTNGNISARTTKTYSEASGWAAALNLAGISSWELPTKDQFALLYATQGSNQSGGMIRPPLTIGGNYYWTRDVGVLAGPNSSVHAHYAFAPNAYPASASFKVFADTTAMSFWAVAAVPEPTTFTFMLVGVVGLILFKRYRKAGS